LAEAFERPALISAISKELLQNGYKPNKWREQARRRHDLEYRLDAQQHEAAGLRIDKDMALLALDLFARIIAARIDAAPLFPRFSRSG